MGAINGILMGVNAVVTGTTDMYTLKQSSKWPIFNFIFSDLALMLLK